MKHHYPLTLFSCLVLIGCKKQAPEPPLTGRWDWVQAKTTSYNYDGTVASEARETPTSPGRSPYYMIMTADSMLTYQVGYTSRRAYQRSGTTISTTSGDLTILSLEEHKLTFRYTKFFNGRLDSQLDTEYQR